MTDRDTTTRTRARAPGVVENPPNGGAQASPQARLRAVPLLRSQGARRTDANQTPTSACRGISAEEVFQIARTQQVPWSMTGTYGGFIHEDDLDIWKAAAGRNVQEDRG